jgi:hypothetical protein
MAILKFFAGLEISKALEPSFFPQTSSTQPKTWKTLFQRPSTTSTEKEKPDKSDDELYRIKLNKAEKEYVEAKAKLVSPPSTNSKIHLYRSQRHPARVIGDRSYIHKSGG